MKSIHYLCLLLVLRYGPCAKDDSVKFCDETTGTQILTEQLSSLYGSTKLFPVFPNSRLLTIDPYSYIKNGHNYIINPGRVLPFVMSNCDFLDSVDIQDPEPRFSLPVINAKLYAVCISNAVLRQRQNAPNSIDNVENIIWTWNNSLSSGQVIGGRLVIDYSDGQKVIKGKPSPDSVLSTLQSGQVYFLSMWAWNDAGTEVVQSSTCYPFVIKNKRIDYDNYYFFNGKWQLASAVDISHNLDYTGSFPIRILQFGLFGCNPVSNLYTPTFYYVDKNLFITPILNDDGSFTLPKSENFSNPIQIDYACDEKLIFETKMHDTLYQLTYHK